MADWTQDQAKDPMRYLMRRGEDCTGCYWLDSWLAWGIPQKSCSNASAPITKREHAPEKRCHMWKPKTK